MAKIVKDVVAALIEKDGLFLVAQRNQDDSFGGLWEFPGGSVEKGESREEALKREIKEELGLDIEVGEPALVFDDEIPALKINIYLYSATIKEGTPKAIDCQDVRWVSLKELGALNLAPADIKALRWLEAR